MKKHTNLKCKTFKDKNIRMLILTNRQENVFLNTSYMSWFLTIRVEISTKCRMIESVDEGLE